MQQGLAQNWRRTSDRSWTSTICCAAISALPSFRRITPAVQAAGIERILVDFGLEQDRGKRFALWSLLYLLDAAPALDVCFEEAADREAARNFMDLLERPDASDPAVMQLSHFDSRRFPARLLAEEAAADPRIRWQSWSNPLEPDELAGLACESDVESRLVDQARRRLESRAWAPARKPLRRLGKEPWTLLVQAVDHHVPAVAALLEAFRFIPNWRIDDVMVSYAVDGGGVGPHFDQYDVFLVQGLGRRRWQVGGLCDSRPRCCRTTTCACSRASSRSTNGSSSRATSSTCRRASPTTASPWATTA